MGLMILFTHLKIILLQCFQFSVSAKINSIQTDPKKHLDRGLGNAEWKFQFSKTKINHLPRIKSNHCPILVDTNPKIGKV